MYRILQANNEAKDGIYTVHSTSFIYKIITQHKQIKRKKKNNNNNKLGNKTNNQKQIETKYTESCRQIMKAKDGIYTVFIQPHLFTEHLLTVINRILRLNLAGAKHKGSYKTTLLKLVMLSMGKKQK
jgi:hypothetical protein